MSLLRRPVPARAVAAIRAAGAARRGMSLLESVISFFILALVVALLINLVPTSMSAVARAEEMERADTLAQSLLADQSALAFSSLVVGTSTDLATSTAGSVTYAPHLDIFAISGHNPKFLKGLRLTVRWTDHGQSRSTVHELWVSHLAGQ